MSSIFDEHSHPELYAVRAPDPKVFVPAKARFAKPKSAKEAAALRDMDDAEQISKEMQRSAGTLHRPQN
jgi:hypothetical protein